MIFKNAFHNENMETWFLVLPFGLVMFLESKVHHPVLHVSINFKPKQFLLFFLSRLVLILVFDCVLKVDENLKPR